jgi:hypothetical protein
MNISNYLLSPENFPILKVHFIEIGCTDMFICSAIMYNYECHN